MLLSAIHGDQVGNIARALEGNIILQEGPRIAPEVKAPSASVASLAGGIRTAPFGLCSPDH